MSTPPTGQAQLASRLANDSVARAVRQWQDRLLQLDRRNSLLYFKADKRGVQLKDLEPDGLLARLATSRSGLAFAYAEKTSARAGELFVSPEESEAKAEERRVIVKPGDVETTLQPLELQKRLLALAKRNREWVEEQGISVLYIALGTLNWLDEDQVAASSPLLLVPCELTRKSPRDPFYLVADDTEDLSLNATLRHKLSHACGIDLPDDTEGSVEHYLSRVEQLVRNRDGFTVSNSVVVATFPFSKLAMWEDLHRMATPGAARHPLVRRLGGDGAALATRDETGPGPLPMDDRELAGARLDDLLDVRDQFAVVDADFSQLRAIEMARSGRNLVIHGPPGTGKSQTIANIIATLLAERKRVLFVSEKKAALDVVKRRLSEVGLGSLCLDLHSERAKKASVYAQLRDGGLDRNSSAAAFPFDRLIARRSELNELVRAMHRVREPLGQSVFQVHARLAAIGEMPRLDSELGTLSDLDAVRLREVEDAVQRIARRPDEFREHHTSHWRVLHSLSPSPRMGDVVHGVLERIRTTSKTVAEGQAAIDARLELSGDATLERARMDVDTIAHLEADPGDISEAWLREPERAHAYVLVDFLERVIAERATLQRALAASHRAPERLSGCAQRLERLREVSRSAGRYVRARGAGWDREVLRDTSAAIANARLASESLLELASANSLLCITLQRSVGCGSRRESDDAVRFARQLLAVGTIPPSWITQDAILVIRVLVAEARRLQEELTSTEANLASKFGLEIIERVDYEMLVRVRTDHRSPIRWIRASYWRDRRILRGCMHRPGALRLDAAQAAIEGAIKIQHLRFKWGTLDARLGEGLGQFYRGRESDWGHLEVLLETVLELYAKNPQQQVAAAALLMHPELLAAADSQSERVAELRELVGRLWPETEATSDQSFIDASSDAAGFAEVATTLRDECDSTGALRSQDANLEVWTKVLELGKRLEELESTFAASAESLQACLGASYRGWATSVVGIRAALNWVGTLEQRLGRPIPQTLCEMVTARRAYPQLAELRSRQQSAIAAFDDAWRAGSAYLCAERLPWPSWREAAFEAIDKWCAELLGDAEGANDWLDYQVASDRLDAALASGCTDAARAATQSAEQVPGIVLRHVLLVWLEGVYSDVSALQVAPRDLMGITREFRKLDRQLPVSARQRVRDECSGALSGLSSGQKHGEMGVLNHQLSLRKRQLPVRKLIERIPNLLPAIKPCFMMSPLAVSQYLPRGMGEADTLSFDAVIFDEASQIFPEDAVPSIARARHCIVVGDQQQLPPTNFFRAEEDDDENDEPEESGNRLQDVESILDALVGMRGSGVSDVYLQVHYRSQHDNLIRYSNHYFYEDRLLTFPSALGSRPGCGVRAVYVPEGRYEAGGSRSNRREAERVVELVFELMESQPDNESIGVVALSRPQADLIQQLIDQRRLDDRRFDERFAEEARERFFVKNLENVQGDERDHILLSVGYGPTTGSGVVPNRFGPLNADGGHRRLNVAVSRARRSMTVVHSLRPEDIRSETQGAGLLRRYLEYARDGEAAIEGEVSATTGGEAESPFEEAVGRALEARGYRIARQVGCAKYRIDLAVRSENGDGYDLAVECDGATYHRSPSARDRDRIRQEVLERLGWQGRIHRVWSTAWIRNPKAECEAIVKAIESARALPRDRVAKEDGSAELKRAPIFMRPPTQLTSDATWRSMLPSKAERAFASYSQATLRHFRVTEDLRDESPQVIAQMVRWVVEVEEPVHLDLVVERVRRHYDLRRAGVHVRTTVERGVESAVHMGRVAWLPRPDGKRGHSDFLWTPEKRSVSPRGASSDGSVRAIERVCEQELAAGVVQLVRGMIGAPKEDVVLATARAFGYARTGGLVEASLSKVIDRLVAERSLLERLGSLVVANDVS